MNNTDEILKNLAANQKKEVPELNRFEKQRLLSKTLDKVDFEKQARHFKFKRAVTVCAACMAIVTTVAAAGFFGLDSIFYRYLSGSDTNVTVSGENIKARDSSNGVTVAAKQIIGDDYGFYVIFNVSGQENTAKPAVPNTAEVEIKGAQVYQCSDIIRMNDELSDSFMLHIMSSENLQGKKISVRLNGDDDNNSANWKLNWKIDYSNSAKSFDVSKMIKIYGGTALWKSVSVSPLSASVRLSKLSGANIYDKNPNDLITVTMKDGSVFRSDSGDDTDTMQDTDLITMSFNKIIDINKVQSISFAGVVYEMN